MRAMSVLVAGILLSTVVSMAARTVRTQSVPRPLSAADIEHGLRAAVTNGRMAALVKQYKVDFKLTDGIEKDLRNAGASDNLILQISRSRTHVKSNFVEKSPGKVGLRRQLSAAPRTRTQAASQEIVSLANKYRLG